MAADPEMDDPGGTGDSPEKGDRLVTGLIVLVLSIIVFQVIYLFNSGKTQTPTATSTGAPIALSTQAPTAPSTPPPVEASRRGPQAGSSDSPTPGAMSGTAAQGNIKMDRLVAGLVKLEESPVPLTAGQAKKMLAIMGTLDGSFIKIDYLSAQIDGILTPAQKEYLSRQVTAGGPRPIGTVIVQDVKRVKDRLIAIAGQGISTPIAFPDNYRPVEKSPEPGLPFVPTFFLLVNCFDGLEKGITADQAKKLLPIVNAYPQSGNPDKLTSELLGVLTAEQKKEIDKVIKGLSKNPQDMVQYPPKLDKLLQEKAK